MSEDEKRELNIDLLLAASEAKAEFLSSLAARMGEYEGSLPEGFVDGVAADMDLLARKTEQLVREIA